MTGRLYEAEDVVWYGNALQAARYYQWGAKPVDIDVSGDTGKWIFAFTKDDHKKYILRWNEQGKDQLGNFNKTVKER